MNNAAADPPHVIEKLKNGMTILLVPRRDMNHLVYISLVMKNGKIDENKNTLSYTHAGEHLLAKFTSRKYPKYDLVKKRWGIWGLKAMRTLRIIRQVIG